MYKKLLMAGMAVGIAGMARAATVTYSDTTAITVPDSISVNVQQFDNTVGGAFEGMVLTSVTLSLIDAEQHATLALFNDQGEEMTWSITLLSGSIQFGNGSESTTAVISYFQNHPVPLGASSLPVQSANFTSENTYSGGLDDFIGTGYVPSMEVAFNGSWGVSGMGQGDTFGMPVHGGSAGWSVTYTYEPIPEPASMGLLAVGGALLAFQRRRRRA